MEIKGFFHNYSIKTLNNTIYVFGNGKIKDENDNEYTIKLRINNCRLVTYFRNKHSDKLLDEGGQPDTKKMTEFIKTFRLSDSPTHMYCIV